MIPDISRHETTNMNAQHTFQFGRKRNHQAHAWRRPGARCCLCFRSSGAQIAAAQPLNSGFSSLPVVFFPRKPLLTCFQAHPCLIENNQRGLSVWGARAPYEGVGGGRSPGRLGAPKWKPNGQLDGGVLVPRIADSV